MSELAPSPERQEEPETPQNETDDNGAPATARSLLGFLERTFPNYSPLTRNIIGLSVTLLLIVVVLHATVAPTYVEGHVFVKEDETSRSQAKGYRLESALESFPTNDSGYWLLPFRGGIFPRKTNIKIFDPDEKFVGEFSFWAPWPVLSAISTTDFNVEIAAFKTPPEVRVKQARNGASVVASIFPSATVAYAQAQWARQAAAPSSKFPYVMVHLEDLGDISCRDVNWCGTRGESRRLEGFEIRLPKGLGDVHLSYMCHVENTGDTAWMKEGQFCGTRGESRRIEGFALRLEGSDADDYVVSYQAWLQDSGATPVMRGGQFAGTRGLGRRVEAIRLSVDRAPVLTQQAAPKSRIPAQAQMKK